MKCHECELHNEREELSFIVHSHGNEVISQFLRESEVEIECLHQLEDLLMRTDNIPLIEAGDMPTHHLIDQVP